MHRITSYARENARNLGVTDTVYLGIQARISSVFIVAVTAIVGAAIVSAFCVRAKRKHPQKSNNNTWLMSRLRAKILGPRATGAGGIAGGIVFLLVAVFLQSIPLGMVL
jgi:hypothetical protein